MAQESQVTEYGRFKVQKEIDRGGLGKTEKFYVQNGMKGDRIRVYGGENRAKTLAAVLDSAGAVDFDVLPMDSEGLEEPRKHNDDADEWEVWADDALAVPAEVAVAGKAAVAGFLKVVHRERESWIGTKLGVSEATVRQYLSDLRAGRR